jgi:hypothetical protein
MGQIIVCTIPRTIRYQIVRGLSTCFWYKDMDMKLRFDDLLSLLELKTGVTSKASSKRINKLVTKLFAIEVASAREADMLVYMAARSTMMATLPHSMPDGHLSMLSANGAEYPVGSLNGVLS